MQHTFRRPPAVPVFRACQSGPGEQPKHSAIWRAVHTVALSAGIAAFGTAHAQEQTTSQDQGTQAIQEVVVTGSLIKRADFETPSPVQVITADDMQQSGFTTIAQVLNNLSANGQGSLSQSFSGAFAGGATGIALRGLTVGATLTLVDSERMVAYPLSDDGERTFVDVSSIPMLAVDHIDVLKDGASAAYGSDAIAGVINVVLKKTFTGLQFSADGGTSVHSDGTDYRLTGIGGLGDLAANGYNAYLAVEFRHQNQILDSSRNGVFATQNWEAYGGNNTLYGAGSLFTNTGITPDPTGTGAYLVPTAGEPFNGPGVVFTSPACPSAAAMAADQCTYYPGEQIQPQTSNLNIIGRITAALAGDWQATVTASFFQSDAQQVGNYPNTIPGPGFSPGSPIQYPVYGPGFALPSSPLTLTVPVGNPMNPTNEPLYPVATLFEVGLAHTDFSTDTYRLFTEFAGTTLGWDVDLNLGEMYALTTQTYYGAINYSALQQALDNGYVFGEGGADVASFSPVLSSSMSDSLQVADLRFTRQLFTLPGGPLSFAVGGGFFHRFLDSTQSPDVDSGLYDGLNLAYAEGGQSDYNAYGEIVAPIIHGLELDVSGRYDHYDHDIGGAAVPKLGLKWSPIKQVTFRGTWGEGFRAPNPAEAGNAEEAYLGGNFAYGVLCPSSNASPAVGQPAAYHLNNVTTPTTGDVASFCNFGPVFAQGTNPDLKPENSTNWTAGIILTPVDQVNLSVDYWSIKIDNFIVDTGEFGALPWPPTPVSVTTSTGTTELPVCTNAACTTTKQESFTNEVPIIFNATYENAGSIHVDGVDVDFITHWDLGYIGKLSAQLNYSHTIQWEISDCYAGQCGSVELAGTHGPSYISGDTGTPKDKAVFSLSWDRGPFDVTWTVNYTGHYSVIDPALGQDDCYTALSDALTMPRFTSGTFPGQFCNVPSFTYVNLYASYAINPGLVVYGSVDNLFNTPPPVDLETYGSGLLAYNTSLEQQGAVGAFFDLGVKYKF